LPTCGDASKARNAATPIEKKTGDFDPKEFHNRYVDALKSLIAEKQRKKGEKVIQDPDADAPPSRGSNVIDLMAALKKSLGEGGGANDNKGARKPAAKKAPAKKAAAPAKKVPARKRA